MKIKSIVCIAAAFLIGMTAFGNNIEVTHDEFDGSVSLSHTLVKSVKSNEVMVIGMSTTVEKGESFEEGTKFAVVIVVYSTTNYDWESADMKGHGEVYFETGRQTLEMKNMKLYYQQACGLFVPEGDYDEYTFRLNGKKDYVFSVEASDIKSFREKVFEEYNKLNRN